MKQQSMRLGNVFPNRAGIEPLARLPHADGEILLQNANPLGFVRGQRAAL